MTEGKTSPHEWGSWKGSPGAGLGEGAGFGLCCLNQTPHQEICSFLPLSDAELGAQL